MRREFHVRFCEGPGVQSPRATRLVVLVKTRSARERVMASLKRYLSGVLRLPVNEQKSRVAPMEQCVFLGTPEFTDVPRDKAVLVGAGLRRLPASAQAIDGQKLGRLDGNAVSEARRVPAGLDGPLRNLGLLQAGAWAR